MAVQKSFLRFLTRVTKKNKSGTSQTIYNPESIRANASKGGTLYISNNPPQDPPSEAELIAQEVKHLLLYILEQGEPATHDEIHYILFMMERMLEEVQSDAA
jgi:hypothetical protein